MNARIFTLSSLLLLTGVALGDTLTLKDGTKLEGAVVEQKADEVVFEHAVGGARTKSTFKKSDVKSLDFGPAGKTAAKPAEKAPEKKPDPVDPGDHEYGELEGYKHSVIIVIDRSGSMAIADRFAKALDEVDHIIDHLPAGTGFGVYLFDTKAVSVFESNSVKAKDPQRARLRKKIQELGGLDRAAFTDLTTALPSAIRARPDAIYLLSDGVPTKGDEEAEKIVKTIKDVMPTKRFPIHVTAIRGGEHVEGLEESDEVARANLRRIAVAFGGRYRERDARPKETVALKRKSTPNDDVELHFYHRNREFTQRELRHPTFDIEVRDALFGNGDAVIEYAHVTFELRTRTDQGVVFDEVTGLDLEYRPMDAEKKTTFGLGGTLEGGPKSFWSHVIKVVRPQDAREGDDGAKTFVKIPTDGGTLEIVYRRGKKETKKVFAIKVPYRDPKDDPKYAK